MAELSPEVRERLREALERSKALADAKQRPDAKDKEESHAAREAAAKAESLEEDVADKRHFRSLRDKYASWVFRYLIGYSFACVLMLAADGWKIGGFDLPDSVLGYLVGSTAASAIGLVLAVTHGLFKR